MVERAESETVLILIGYQMGPEVARDGIEPPTRGVKPKRKE